MVGQGREDAVKAYAETWEINEIQYNFIDTPVEAGYFACLYAMSQMVMIWLIAMFLGDLKISPGLLKSVMTWVAALIFSVPLLCNVSGRHDAILLHDRRLLRWMKP